MTNLPAPPYSPSVEFGGHTQNEFNVALQSFYGGCQRISNDYYAKNFPNNPPGAWELQRLQKRIRIVHDHSVHCFVDMATGDVLKAAGYKAPAKHARGNIYDEKNGLGSMGPYGPAYLR